MDSYKKLFNNVIIFAIGNLGSKIITFLLVPLYTHYLTQTEYGSADLVLTTSNMLLPIVSAVMYEAILRFSLDNTKDDSTTMTNAVTISAIGYLLLLIIYPVLSYFNFLGDSLPYMYVILLMQIIRQLFSQYARGIGRVKVFAVQGMITSFLIGAFNILFIVGLGWGLQGYFLAYILAYAGAILYIVIMTHPLKGTHCSKLSMSEAKDLLTYAIPLIPNSLMWWLINSSSRYFINFFVGLGANGLFAVASRIPSFISIVSQVFSQAWQLSAFEEYGKEDESDFYSSIFDLYAGILLIITSLIILIIKPGFSLVFSDEFFMAWQPVPFLLLGSVFSALSGFIGVIYTASKQTKGVFKTSVYGGISSLLLNLLLIPTLGIIGAGISSMFSFFIMFVLRYYDTREMVLLNINWKKLLITSSLVLLQAITLFIDINVYTEMIINGFIVIIIIIMNRNVFHVVPFIWKMIITSIKRK